MRISKIRLSRIEKRAQEQVLVDEKAEEFRRRMEAAQARADKRYRDKLSPEEFEQFITAREAYYKVYEQRVIDLRKSMPDNGIADKLKIARHASKWAMEKTGFRRPDV
ncbi:MAG: hypothetical protein ABW118_13955 [Candidatus Thiodiazotropha sp.]